MLKSLIFFSLRNLLKNGKSTFIIILGLTVGLTCSLIIYYKIRYELSFDRFHTEAENTYRIVRQTKGLGLNLPEGEWEYRVGVFGGLPSAIKSEIPELKQVIPLLYQRELQINVTDKTAVNKNSKFKFNEGTVFTEPSFFQAFDYKGTDFKWLRGSPKESLSNPFSIVLPLHLAEKYFGNKDPIGESLIIDDRNFKVTGVITGLPVNSDHSFQIFLSFSSIEIMAPDFANDWDGLGGFQCYVMLHDPSQKDIVEGKIKEVYAQHATKEEAENRLFKLQPLKDIHHDARFGNFNNRTIGMETLVTLGCIGIFLLIMACANYSNLSLARSKYRTGEVGIRKTLGGKRWHVLIQFFGESLMLTSFSAIFALLLSLMLIKSYPDLAGIPLNQPVHFDFLTISGLILLVVIVSFVCSSYPSLLISASQPVDLVKKKFGVPAKGVLVFTKSMVIVQFVISLLMIVGTITVYRQYQFLTNSDMGFDKEAVFTVPLPKQETTLLERFKTVLLNNTAIKNVSFSNSSPAQSVNWSDVSRFIDEHENRVVTQIVTIDTSYLETYGLKLVAGSNINESESGRDILINEELSKQLGFKTPEEAVGSQLSLFRNPNFKVIISGVLQDYHYDTFYNKIRPTVLMKDKDRVRIAGIKLTMNKQDQDSYLNQLKNVLAYTENTWRSVFQGELYEYEFIDEKIKSYYKSEENSSRLITAFALITVFIACLGIFGLALYSSEQRSKEIGIRKVNGARISEILSMLNKDLIKWVAISFAIATPIAWYAMHKWLENFAYKTELSWWIFALAGVLALGIALLTVSWQSWKAATRNPVEALRYE